MFHKVTAIGYLGRAPEKRYTPAGKSVTSFSIAVKNQDKTIWINVVMFERLADICHEYLSKGSLIYVEGRLNPGEGGNPKTYKKSDGSFGASYEIIATEVKFLNTSKDELRTHDDAVPF